MAPNSTVSHDTGSSKTITLSVEEVIVTDLATKKSYFDEYKEIESSDENENVTIGNILLTILGHQPMYDNRTMRFKTSFIINGVTQLRHPLMGSRANSKH